MQHSLQGFSLLARSFWLNFLIIEGPQSETESKKETTVPDSTSINSGKITEQERFMARLRHIADLLAAAFDWVVVNVFAGRESSD